MGNQQGLRGATRLVACQLGLTLLISIIALVGSGTLSAISVILGGMVSLVPNAYFATQLFRYQGAHAARRIVASFYKGEAAKFLLTFVLFALVFVCFQIIPWVFFVTYILVQMVIWFAPLFFP
ncbi:MAG: ATP synthase subunit I [Legionellales bacterium]|nr:ATP synthase subunit I [Legionellales bacterium]